jgi:hypothetical protein
MNLSNLNAIKINGRIHKIQNTIFRNPEFEFTENAKELKSPSMSPDKII